LALASHPAHGLSFEESPLYVTRASGPELAYPAGVVSNADLAEAFFVLAESHPPGELRLALLRAAYAVFDHPRELDGARRLPETIPLEVLPTVTMLRGCRSRDAVTAAAQSIAVIIERDVLVIPVGRLSSGRSGQTRSVS